MKASEYLTGHWNKNSIWTHLEWPKHQTRFKLIADYLIGKTFCDVGCGLGHSTDILKRFKPGKWSGVEFYQPNVDEGIKLFEKIDFYYCDESTLDIHSACGKRFDSVVCSEVIEHVERPVLLVMELLRITKKRLVITTPCVYVNDPGHLRIYTKEMIESIMKKCKVSSYDIMKKIKVNGKEVFWYVVIDNE